MSDSVSQAYDAAVSTAQCATVSEGGQPAANRVGSGPQRILGRVVDPALPFLPESARPSGRPVYTTPTAASPESTR